MVKWLAVVGFVLVLPHTGLALAAESSNGGSNNDSQSSIMGGDAGMACQMMLCLSDAIGKSTGECKPALDKYYDLDSKKRPGFLAKCPLVKDK